MTTDAARLVAGLLARRLGLESDDVLATLGDNPLRAAMALSLIERSPAAGPEPADVLRVVASMVGGCPLCLGENAECDECRGAGRPGYRMPDGTALVRWVSPALRRMGLCVGRPHVTSLDDNPPGGERP